MLSGLIQWKIVLMHLWTGISCFVTGIRASNNNQAETVYKLFLDLIDIHGLPSRIRGDHGMKISLLHTHGGVRGVAQGHTFGAVR